MISLWLTPIEKDGTYLQNLINELASAYQAPVFLPHVTLYSPADLEKDELVELITHIAQSVEPLFVTSHGLNHTNNIWETIFIKLKRSLELSELNKQIVNGIPDPAPYEFLPHINLIYKQMERKRREYIIRNLAVRNSYTMDKITAMKTGPDVEQWEKIVEVHIC